MSVPNQRAALAALQAARPTLARLDATRHPEEIAADLIEIWSSIETALRSLVGGSVLSGQPLIRELRERELLGLEQAHALLELLAVRERVQRTEYTPGEGDIAVAREAYAALEQALTSGPGAPAASAAPPAAAPAPLPAADGATGPAPGAAIGARSTPVAAVVIALLVLAGIGGGFWWYRQRSGVPGDIATGISDYQAGRREAARADFEKAARAYPTLALPHLYLARIAREQGDFATAGTELKTALQLEPRSAVANRELGAFFLARGAQFAAQQRPDLASADYDAARRAYVRALQSDPADTLARGYLACTLAKLGRAPEAASWLARAGPGAWSACVQGAPPPGAPAAQTPAPRGP